MTSAAINVFRVLVGVTSVMMLLSPSPAIYRIYKTHEIGHTSIIPLASMMASSHVWMIYGYLADLIFPVFAQYVFGDVLVLVYIAIYYRWTPEKVYVRKVLAVLAVVIVVTSVYAVLGALGHTNQTRAQVTRTAGFIADTMALLMYGSPLEKVFHVLKHRSAVFIPILMVCAAVTNNTMWFTYGILLHDWFIIAPNIVFLTVGTSQICLYWIFNPKTHPLTMPSDNDTTKTEQDSLPIRVMSPKDEPINNNESPVFTALSSPLEAINNSRN